MAKSKSHQFSLDHESRRAFLGRACAGLGVGSMVNVIAQLQLMQAAIAESGPDPVGDDYKALICVFLGGGVDMNNVVVPIGTHPQANIYQDTRKQIAIPEEDIVAASTVLQPNGGVAGGEQYGLHPSCKNLASLFNDGELAWLCNVGTLAFPTTVENYGVTPLPNQLFSHSDQVQEWMSSVADGPFLSGWGGRVADMMHAAQNPDSKVSMMVTAAGLTDFLVSEGGSVPQYTVTNSGAVSLSGFGTNYASAIGENGEYLNSTAGRRLAALETIVNHSHDHIIEQGYSEVVRRARISESLVGEALQAATNTGVDFDSIFTEANGTNSLGRQLKVISQLIAGRKSLGNKRQIFFVSLGGWDTHQYINTSLPTLLGRVDEAVGQFVQGMKVLEAADADFSYADTLLFQASDFNRTFTPNGAPGDAAAGTDHAWGTHAFMVGGAVEGQKIYGSFPDLRMDGNGTQNRPNDNRGRWIPRVSVDQYTAVLADWLGVERSTQLPIVLPNLNRFANPFDPANNLNFINPLA